MMKSWKILSLVLCLFVPLCASAQGPASVASFPSVSTVKTIGAATSSYRNISIAGVGIYSWSASCPGTPDDVVYVQPNGTTGCYVLGAFNSTAMKVTNPGVFTNTQPNLYDYSSIHGANAGAIYFGSHGYYMTEAVTGAAINPAGSSSETHALGGYVQTYSTNAAAPGLGAQLECDVKVAAGECWSQVGISRSTIGLGAGVGLNGYEQDINPDNTDDTGFGFLATINSPAGITGTFNGSAFEVQSSDGTTNLFWGAALDVQAAAANFAVRAAPLCVSGSCASPVFRLQARSSGSAVSVDQSVDIAGDWLLTSAGLNVSANQVSYTSSNGNILSLNSTNVSGPYAVMQTNSTTFMDIGTGKQVFGGSYTALDLGVDVRSTGHFALGAGGTVSLDLTSTGAHLLGLGSDTGKTTATVCEDTTTHLAYFGSGTGGICAGTSSRRFKNDIQDLRHGLTEVMLMRPRSFYMDKAHGDPSRINYGFVAEEAVKAVPQLVGHDRSGIVNNFDYLGMVPVLTKAVQEQQAEIVVLRAEIRALRRVPRR